MQITAAMLHHNEMLGVQTDPAYDIIWTAEKLRVVFAAPSEERAKEVARALYQADIPSRIFRYTEGEYLPSWNGTAHVVAVKSQSFKPAYAISKKMLRSQAHVLAPHIQR